jgi:hypothetical protein
MKILWIGGFVKIINKWVAAWQSWLKHLSVVLYIHGSNLGTDRKYILIVWASTLEHYLFMCVYIDK